MTNETGNDTPRTDPPDAGAGAVDTHQRAASAHRRLTRREDGKVIGGVCAGLGSYTGTDPVLWRIGFVILAVFSGIGVVAYIVALLIIPKGEDGEPTAPAIDPAQSRTWLGIAALVAGVAILAHDVWPWSGGIVWGLLAIGVGLALWSRTGPPDRDDASRFVPERRADPVPSHATPTAGAPADRVAAGSGPGVTGASDAAPPPEDPPAASVAGGDPPPSRRRRRARSPLGRMTLGAAAVVLGAGLVLDNLGVVRMTPAGTTAALLLVVAAGLLVGTWWGSARWLIAPGALLLVALAGFSTTPGLSFDGGFGERTWRPRNPAEVRDTYELFAGEALLDVSDAGLEGRRRRITVRVMFGQLLVVVPDDASLVVRGRVQGGEMEILGRRTEGWELDEIVRDRGAPGAAVIELDVTTTFGEMAVVRDSGRSAAAHRLDHFDRDDRGPFGDRGFDGGSWGMHDVELRRIGEPAVVGAREAGR